MNATLSALVLVLGAGLLVVIGLKVINMARARQEKHSRRLLQLNVFNRFAQEQGLAVMTSNLPITDLRLFERRRGLVSADALDRFVAGRWHDRPVLAAALRRPTPQGAEVTWMTLVIAEAELMSVDTLIYRPDLLHDMTGQESLEDPGHLLAVPGGADALRSLGVLCADLEVGRMWRAETLRRRIEELGDAVVVEIKGKYLAVLWVSPPLTPASLEKRLDSVVALVRRMPQVEPDLQT